MNIGEGDSDVARLADMLAAMGTEPRLRIMRLLLSAHPDGLVVSDIQQALGIPGPTLSHHLEKLRTNELVVSRREGTYVRYSVCTESLRELLGFLYAECCGRNKAMSRDELFQRCEC
jgi:DNA-binding transcriptional ArsR family regulator